MDKQSCGIRYKLSNYKYIIIITIFLIIAKASDEIPSSTTGSIYRSISEVKSVVTLDNLLPIISILDASNNAKIKDRKSDTNSRKLVSDNDETKTLISLVSGLANTSLNQYFTGMNILLFLYIIIIMIIRRSRL